MTGADATKQTITESGNTLKQISDAMFAGNAGRSILVLIIALVVGSVLGKVFSVLLRRLSRGVSRGADASTNLGTVNRLRRMETWLILSIAVVRVLFIILALYFWWVFTHPNGKPTALVGASAVLIVIVGGVLGPMLRDIAFGSGMMAEHWYGVGDLITIEPFTTIQGVVERITLRSTRIRGLNGEVIWIANQNIQGVRIAQKGVWTMAIEMFVSSRTGAQRLIDEVNVLLPTGPSLLANPLAIMKIEERKTGVWQVTALGEIAPGRNWLIENNAIDLLKKLDEAATKPVLLAAPVARFADNDTERQFARAVKNAKKTRRPARRKLPLPAKQLAAKAAE